MKTHYLACFASIVLGSAFVVAGDFVNLDFEHPDLSHAVPYPLFPGSESAPTTEALRGWTLTADVIQLDRVAVSANNVPPVCLTVGAGNDPTFGKYALYLANPTLAPNSLQPIYHLSQLGTIPAGATDLVFFRFGPSPGGLNPNFVPFKILINGQSVPYTEAGVGYANVSAFAGQQVSLEFVFPKGGSTFDIAGFTIAPEPSTYALFGLGAVALWWQFRRRSNS